MGRPRASYRDLAPWYDLLFPLGERQRAFLDRLLESRPTSSLLDVGCGTGEQLAHLSARGLQAWGLEPDPDMFARLAARAWAGPEPTLIRGGTEVLGGLGRGFDLVLCLGNTLPHLPGREAAAAAVADMARLLEEGGRLVIQTVNFDRLAAGLPVEFPVITRERGGRRVAFARSYDLSGWPGRVLFRTRLETGGQTLEGAWELTPVLRRDLEEALGAAGLTRRAFFGDWDPVPHTCASPALVAVAERGAG